MRWTGFALVVAIVAFFGVAHCQRAYWCDDEERRETLYRSLNSLRYSKDFDTWTNSTGWAVPETNCAPQTNVYSNCTAVEGEDGIYDCQSTSVIEEKARGVPLTCTEIGTEGRYLYNCTAVVCDSVYVATGPEVCPCDYFGVDCDMSPQYVQLNLTDNNMGLQLLEAFAVDIYDSIILSKNRFFGELPASIGSLFSLKYLDLGHNEFHGLMPESLGNLTNLELLDVHHNYFAGYYPDYFMDPEEYWDAAVDIQLSHNRFWCPTPTWCMPTTGDGQCATCEAIPSPDRCGSGSTAACGMDLACCYAESWVDACQTFAEDAGEACETRGFPWLVVILCFSAAGVILVLGAAIALLLTRHGQNFQLLFSKNKHELVVAEEEELPASDDVYDIYPDDY